MIATNSTVRVDSPTILDALKSRRLWGIASFQVVLIVSTAFLPPGSRLVALAGLNFYSVVVGLGLAVFVVSLLLPFRLAGAFWLVISTLTMFSFLPTIGNSDLTLVSVGVMATLAFVCHYAGMRLTRQHQHENGRQISLRGLLAFVAIAAFAIQARILMGWIHSHIGWPTCNTILFSITNALTMLGISYAVLRSRYLVVGLAIATIVVAATATLSIFWTPKEVIPTSQLFQIVGPQFAMLGLITTLPVFLARLLGIRICYCVGTDESHATSLSDNSVV